MLKKIKTDSKSFYAYVRQKSKTKVKIRPLIADGNTQVADNEGIAKVLNCHFANIFTAENLAEIPQASEMALRGDNITLQDIQISEGNI